ncbi:MAG: SusD/RagB family nutrient-binding outer membrane lipoprotein [Prevotellaceae bacterium]|jgi:hypothetical protein|nr:SusD/RagB family nutrient-binding outer membrane lipoprotein [Prevotellaceae bacterium]
MKIAYKIAAPVLAAVFTLAGCSNFEDINTNPNGATSVTSGMLATQLIKPILDGQGGYYNVRNKYIISIETTTANIDAMNNSLGRWDFADLAPLRNVEKMISFAPEGGLKNSYTALGHFLRARMFFDLTMRLGDVPYSEALKGESGSYYPAYDTQKDVFAGILDELDEANRLFAEGAKFDGDPFSFGGDPAKWRKLVNALELRVLINLYKRADDTPELKVKERFQQIASSRPLPETGDDMYQVFWNDIHRYNYYRPNDNGSNNRFITTLIIDSLKQYDDRRLFYYVTPTVNSVSAGISSSSKDAYVGVNSLEPINTADIANRNSRLNRRYTERAEGEPTYILSCAEVNFILAEAAARGFISGSAKDYYEKGIRASMKYTADVTPDDADYHHNMKITDASINDYLKSPGVAFASNLAEQIHQIGVQKFFDFFMRDYDNAWFEMRRTGYPAFPINPATNLNSPNTKMPVRWMYASAEYNYNKANVEAAVTRQYGGADDNNGIMWILK